MKKTLILASVCAAMLASCDKTETVEAPDAKAISFANIFVDKSTRATDTTTDNLDEIEVYGWRGADQIFDAQQVNKVGTEWTYSPLKYWEADYLYKFEAIAPVGSADVEANVDGSTLNFTSDAETDLIYAKADKKTDASLTSTPGKVDFTFNHLLSRVMFTFTNGFSEDAAAKIEVSDVTVTNAANNGSIIPASEEATWKIGESTAPIVFVSDAAIALPGAKTVTDHMYLIPNAVGGYEITFTVTLTQGDVVSTYPHTVTLPELTTLANGYSYNFTATLDTTNIDPENELFPIKFNVTEVTDWEEFTDKAVTLK